MRIAFHTFGCRLNRAETLDSESLAIAEGHEIVEPGPDAEIIEVRACSVTARAQRDCEKFIEKLKKDPGLRQACGARNMQTVKSYTLDNVREEILQLLDRQ